MMRTVAAGFALLARVVPILLRDAVGLFGAGGIAYGAWLLHPAAGFIVGGGLLLAGALLSASRE